MRALLDTNILLRGSRPSHPQNAAALAAVDALLRAGRTLCIGSQTIYEFLAVATRPVTENGLGMPHAEADAQLQSLLIGIDVLYDSPAVTTELRRLVVAQRVTGKKIHDARLAATMIVAGVKEVLTFNVDDFKRFSFILPIAPADAEKVLAAS